MNRRLFYAIAALGVFIFILISFNSCNERIDAGYEGILVKLYGSDKGVQDVSLVTGRVWYNPFTENVYEFPTYVQTINYTAFTVNAKDGSVFTVDPTLSFKVRDGQSPVIFKKYRKDIREITETTLFNYIKDAFRIEFNKYSTDSIISNREKFENSIQTNMGQLLKKEGFILEQMTSGIQYPETITEAINAKNAAVQQAMRVENELKVSQAQARKLIVQAEAEAKANELRKQSLNPLLIQQQFIEKWDGKTPIYGNAPAFFKNVQ
ncbi:prohibitin family protein [Flavobacterium selenitireducens]|uniref:prohibitin family protein n=1 Tax=Flavobacterium selenitireducens TaxID=2722704 RepID=UPI00168A7372|nr:prohibitin family protein [Flavobacterium selenitireducens]MBD3581327.1 prohibitin family protein [Flavobacterium selenitireducens]